MDRRIRLIFAIFAVFILVVDLLVYTGLAIDFGFMRNWIGAVVFFLVPFLLLARLHQYRKQFLGNVGFPKGFFLVTGVFLAFYIPKLIYILFLLAENIIIALVFAILKFFGDPGKFPDFYAAGSLDRISICVLPFAGAVFMAIIGGMVFGRFNFRIRHMEAGFSDLPGAFDGFRIVHISDLHLGSLNGNQGKFRRAVEIINAVDADLVLFTGDLVNNLAAEADGWTGLLSEIRSRFGKYAITGNHDYGEFVDWADAGSKQENMEQLLKVHSDIGFRVLMNDSAEIRKNGEKLYIAGVENWGLPPFEQYGDLDKAMKDPDPDGFTILLSHDPSHWDEEVAGKTGIQLTLSGHTHGFQFGIRTRGFKWSPVQYKYPRWIGMYRQGSQILHVSPGLGYIGYAGRIGIPPEISVLTLRKLT